MRATFPTGEGLDAAGDSAAAPTESEADEGEKREKPRLLSLLCAFLRRRMRQGRGGRQTAPYDLCAAFAHFGRGRRLDDPLHRRKSGRPMAAPAKSEADEGEKREKPRLLSLLCVFTPQDAAGKKDADSSRGASSPYSVRQKRLSAKEKQPLRAAFCSAPFLRRITLRGIRRRQSG